MSERRVVVTGLGAVSSLGAGVDELWRGCLTGRGVVEPIPGGWTRYSRLRSTLWAPLGDWDRPTPLLTRLERKQTDPCGRLAVLAAGEALEQAGLVASLHDSKRNRYRLDQVDGQVDGHRAGVFMGTGVGGIHTLLGNASFTFLSEVKKRLSALARDLEENAAARLDDVLADMPTPRAFNSFSVSMAMPNASAALLAVKFGLHGPTPTFTCACASGTVALGRALRAIREGECDLALAGGVEYLADDYGSCFRGFDAVGALTRPVDLAGERANRPFDVDRSGFLFAEGGGAVLVLEEYERAKGRGAPLLAEVRGYGETCDAFSTMVMDPEAKQIKRAIESGLADAGLVPADIDYLNAHGTGTPANDPIEAEVIRDVFGSRVRVNSTKSVLGHTLGASGALEAVVTVRSLQEGRAHLSKNLERPIAELNFLTHSESFPLRHALSQSFAFGGQNAVLVLSKI